PGRTAGHLPAGGREGAPLRPAQDVLGRRPGRGEKDGGRVLAQRRDRRRAVTGAAPPPPLPAGRRPGHARRPDREGPDGARPGAVRGAGQGVRGRRVHPRLPPPGRSRPGRLLRLLPAGAGPPPLETRYRSSAATGWRDGRGLPWTRAAVTFGGGAVALAPA